MYITLSLGWIVRWWFALNVETRVHSRSRKIVKPATDFQRIVSRKVYTDKAENVGRLKSFEANRHQQKIEDVTLSKGGVVERR